MEKTGLVSSIVEATINIESGRKGFAARGKEGEGRISYEEGIDKALSAFQEAHISAESETLILAEYTFLSQELQFCDENDKDSLSSLTQAIQSFDDAFPALQAVEEPGYKTVDKAFPHHKKYRINGFPKDAFHIACISHKTRIQNVLRSPGIDSIEKALLKQRFANLGAAMDKYIGQQRKALST